MDDKRILVFALLGSGTYAKVHAKVYSNHPQCTLKYVWSPTKAHCDKFAGEFKIASAESWECVIDDPDVDCVAVATPDFAHTNYIVKALAAGKHVLVEKPMATSVEECQQIIKARDKSGRKLMVNYHNRWYPALAQAKKIIASGKIGRPVAGNLVLSDTITWTINNMKWGSQASLEWFLMSHLADLALWLFDDVPNSVHAFAHQGVLSSHRMKCQDLVKANVKMNGGAVIHLETSWILASGWRNPINECLVNVQGETGRIDVNGDYENLTVVTDSYSTPFTNLLVTEESPIKDFVQCILHDTPVPVTAEDGLLATALVEAVIFSYQNKTIVNFNESKEIKMEKGDKNGKRISEI